MSHRLAQVNELIRQELNRLFLTEAEFPKNCLVTIAKVQVSKDLRHAKVALSVLPFTAKEKVQKELHRTIGHLQFLLNKKLSFYPLPRLRFVFDQTEQEAADIEELLDRLKENG